MSEITRISPQVKDKTRCNIEIDGRFYCGMSLETVVKNRLKAGMSISPDRLAALQLESEKQTALDRALTHISASMKSEKELRTYLAGKGYLPEVSDYVIGKMKEYGYLDDAAYAAAYAESAAKRKGKRLIAAELKRKGVSDSDIGEALGGISDETQSAERVLGKYLRGKTPDRRTLQRAYAYLIGKGFDHETAREALRAWGETDED